MGVLNSLTTKVQAHAAAVTHRYPARRMQIIMVAGPDGGQLTIECISRIVRKQGAKVGIISAQFVEIAGERAEGSDQADVLGDPFRMQALLAQMRRAGCNYILIEVPPQLPAHGFAGLQPTLLVMRRCGDSHLNEASNTARRAIWRKLLGLHPAQVVLNRDDPCYALPAGLHETATMTYGTHEKAECKIGGVQIHPKGSAISLVVDHQTDINLTTSLTGKTATYSVVAAAAAAYMLHIPIGSIEDGIAAVTDQPGALQYIPANRPYQIVIDGNTTPDGVAETLETLKHFTKNRLLAVVGASLLVTPEWRQQIGELAAQSDRLIITDGEYTAEESPVTVRQQLLEGVVAAGADARTEEVADRAEALEKALSIARRGDTLVILASTQRPYRQLGLERQPWNDAQQLEQHLS
ncbi:MAG TPA: cyanophycin synthetase [Candidatus Saccharimonadales bacterium]|nr:cyanophycin synthetase [Candidatus Saccharimonadales bacterium]